MPFSLGLVCGWETWPFCLMAYSEKKKTKHIVRTHETTRNSMQGIDHIKRRNTGLDPASVVQKLGRGAAREDTPVSNLRKRLQHSHSRAKRTGVEFPMGGPFPIFPWAPAVGSVYGKCPWRDIVGHPAAKMPLSQVPLVRTILCCQGEACDRNLSSVAKILPTAPTENVWSVWGLFDFVVVTAVACVYGHVSQAVATQKPYLSRSSSRDSKGKLK